MGSTARKLDKKRVEKLPRKLKKRIHGKKDTTKSLSLVCSAPKEPVSGTVQSVSESGPPESDEVPSSERVVRTSPSALPPELHIVPDAEADPEIEIGYTIGDTDDDDRPIFQGSAAVSRLKAVYVSRQPSDTLRQLKASALSAIEACLSRAESENVRDEDYYSFLHVARQLTPSVPPSSPDKESEIESHVADVGDEVETPEELEHRVEMIADHLEAVLKDYGPVITSDNRVVAGGKIAEFARKLWLSTYECDPEKTLRRLAHDATMMEVQNQLSKKYGFSLYRYESNGRHRSIDGVTTTAIPVWNELRRRIIKGQSPFGRTLQRWAASNSY
jgi:hypothetical protein